VTVRIGRPFRLVVDSTLPRRQAIAKGNEEIMRRLAALVDEPIRGEYEPLVDSEPASPTTGH
jgi:hypothetical protein